MPTYAATRNQANARLLWAAASPSPDLDEIRSCIGDGADADAVGRSALENRVGPLYWRSLGEAGVRDQLGAVGDALERDAQLRRLQEELLLPRALELIVGPLREARLEPLVFKGPALVGRYPARGLRPMDDIDVILPERQHRAGLDALAEAGWEKVEDRRGDHYDTYLLHPEVPHLPLELHWELSVWRERGNSVRAMTLWESRQPVEIAGVPAFALPAEVELPALATHAGKPFHHFHRLMWSVDIAVVVQAAGHDLDWDRVQSLARRLRCETVLAIALHHATRFGIDVPESLLRLPRNQLRRAALQPLLEDDWPLGDHDDGTIHRLRYALSDSRTRQLGLLLGEITIDATKREVPRRALHVASLFARRVWSGRRRPRNDSEDQGTTGAL